MEEPFETESPEPEPTPDVAGGADRGHPERERANGMDEARDGLRYVGPPSRASAFLGWLHRIHDAHAAGNRIGARALLEEFKADLESGRTCSRDGNSPAGRAVPNAPPDHARHRRSAD